jgi:hypothetical protein
MRHLHVIDAFSWLCPHELVRMNILFMQHIALLFQLCFRARVNLLVNHINCFFVVALRELLDNFDVVLIDDSLTRRPVVSSLAGVFFLWVHRYILAFILELLACEGVLFVQL